MFAKILRLSVHVPSVSLPAENVFIAYLETEIEHIFFFLTLLTKEIKSCIAPLSRAQLFLSHVILCGHTLLISVTSPWGWVAWRLKNERNTAATAILNNEHPSVPPPLSEAEKFRRTKQGEKTLYI